MTKYIKAVAVVLWVLLVTTTYAQPSFPGAQGFGANAIGGRGGQVIYVTNLNPSGPGSLAEALATPGKRYILFKVSGVINTVANIIYGDVTIAGQTSPNGIIVRGILADEIFDTVGTADNIIIRHLRSRPNTTSLRPAGYILDDALRLDGASNVMIDHCSFANAVDEAVQISNTMNLTIGNSFFAETIGEHYALGGMLLNYSSPDQPQDSITIHHCLFNRIGGRYPELSGESPYSAARPLNMEFSYNLFWDQQVPMLYNSNIDPSADPPKDSFFLRMNIIGNRSVTDTTYPYGMFTHSFLEQSNNMLFISDNRMQQYNPIKYSDIDLFYCCNDFIDSTHRPNRDSGVALTRSARFDYPLVTHIPPIGLRQYQIQQGGAYPRDSMERRLMASLVKGDIDNTFPIDSNDYFKDAFVVDYDTTSASYPSDADEDGMPDWWELSHSSDSGIPNGNDTTLSLQFNIQPRYTNIELYLNKLADSLVKRTSTLLTTTSIHRSSDTYTGFQVLLSGTTLKIASEHSRETSFSIYDILGRQVHRGTFTSSVETDLRSFARGVYLLFMESGEHILSEKIRIE